MALHFFHVHNGREFVDTVGSDLPDLAAVRREAQTSAAELLRGRCPGLWSGGDWRMVVTDAGGHEVLTLRFCATQAQAVAPLAELVGA